MTTDIASSTTPPAHRIRVGQRLAELPIQLRAALVVLSAVQLAMASIFLVFAPVSGPAHHANLDLENNFAAWFSGQVFAAVGLAGLLAWSIDWPRLTRGWPFAALGLGFLGLSLEEIIGVHERVGNGVFGADTAGLWVILYLPVLAAGAAVTVAAARRMSRHARDFLLAGLALLVLAVATEIVGPSIGLRTSVPVLAFEESIEVFGALLVGAGLVQHLRRRPSVD